MSDYDKIGESVRNNYRNQGADALRRNIVEALMKDVYIRLFVPVEVLERVVEIVEGTK